MASWGQQPRHLEMWEPAAWPVRGPECGWCGARGRWLRPSAPGRHGWVLHFVGFYAWACPACAVELEPDLGGEGDGRREDADDRR